jgi:hypothetical protein
MVCWHPNIKYTISVIYWIMVYWCMVKREPTSINVNPELWKQAKIEAIKRNMTVTELFEKALADWINYDPKKLGDHKKE